MKPDTVPVALTFADDTIGILWFVVTEYGRDGVPVWSRRDSDAEIAREIAKASKSIPPAKLPVRSWRVLAEEQVPKDRTFRDAWRDRDGRIVVDMPAARELHRERIRRARVSALAVLDIEYQRAGETADKIARAYVVAQKQALRDAPADPRIEQAMTPEELASVWPEGLK